MFLQQYVHADVHASDSKRILNRLPQGLSGVSYKCHGITHNGRVIPSYRSGDHPGIALHV